MADAAGAAALRRIKKAQRMVLTLPAGCPCGCGGPDVPGHCGHQRVVAKLRDATRELQLLDRALKGLPMPTLPLELVADLARGLNSDGSIIRDVMLSGLVSSYAHWDQARFAQQVALTELPLGMVSCCRRLLAHLRANVDLAGILAGAADHLTYLSLSTLLHAHNTSAVSASAVQHGLIDVAAEAVLAVDAMGAGNGNGSGGGGRGSRGSSTHALWHLQATALECLVALSKSPGNSGCDTSCTIDDLPPVELGDARCRQLAAAAMRLMASLRLWFGRQGAWGSPGAATTDCSSSPSHPMAIALGEIYVGVIGFIAAVAVQARPQPAWATDELLVPLLNLAPASNPTAHACPGVQCGGFCGCAASLGAACNLVRLLSPGSGLQAASRAELEEAIQPLLRRCTAQLPALLRAAHPAVANTAAVFVQTCCTVNPPAPWGPGALPYMLARHSALAPSLLWRLGGATGHGFDGAGSDLLSRTTCIALESAARGNAARALEALIVAAPARSAVQQHLLALLMRSPGALTGLAAMLNAISRDHGSAAGVGAVPGAGACLQGVLSLGLFVAAVKAAAPSDLSAIAACGELMAAVGRTLVHLATHQLSPARPHTQRTGELLNAVLRLMNGDCRAKACAGMLRGAPRLFEVLSDFLKGGGNRQALAKLASNGAVTAIKDSISSLSGSSNGGSSSSSGGGDGGDRSEEGTARLAAPQPGPGPDHARDAPPGDAEDQAGGRSAATQQAPRPPRKACAACGAARNAECGSRLRPCTGCNAALYCGRACQKRDWRAGHEAQCALLAAQPLVARHTSDGLASTTVEARAGECESGPDAIPTI